MSYIRPCARTKIAARKHLADGVWADCHVLCQGDINRPLDSMCHVHTTKQKEKKPFITLYVFASRLLTNV